jgi:hypothetical protein
VAELETVPASDCCSPDEQESCCERDVKSECCDADHDSGCGCAAGAKREQAAGNPTD